MRRRQEFNSNLWQSITKLDYDDVMLKRKMYYCGVRDTETREACRIYKFYRARLKEKGQA